MPFRTPFFSACLLSLCFVFVTIATPQNASGSSKDAHFDYENPIQTEPVLNPQIVKVGKTWYMTGTAAQASEEASQGDAPGVNLWSSTNLMQWKFVSVLISPDAARWYAQGLKAPELFPFKSKWYLTFSCPTNEQPAGSQSVGLAVADKIAGPYRILTADKPLTAGSDATLFQDDDGKIYLFRSGISAIQVDLERGNTIGEPFNVIERGPDSAWDGPSPRGLEVGVEAPAVFKHGHNYYLLYASYGRGYEEGYATAPKVTGPWLKYHNNPVYGAQDEDWSRIYNHEYTQSAAVPYRQLAGGSPFIGPDGGLWFACHGTLKGAGQEPRLVITPVEFEHEVVHMVATWTPQVVFLPHRFRVRLGDTRLASQALAGLAAQP